MKAQKAYRANWNQPFAPFTSSIVAASADTSNAINGFRSLKYAGQPTTVLLTDVANKGQALAARQLVHLVDAAEYLSAAISAYCQNLEGHSVHLAYYAQVRSVFSLYLSSGICIKYQDSYYMDKAGHTKTFNGKRTHTVISGLWKDWSSRKDSRSLILDSIRISPSITLNSILTALGTSRPVDELAQFLGLDVIKLAKDHTARDKYTYDPFLESQIQQDFTALQRDFIFAVWSWLLPEAVSVGFDRDFILYAIDSVFSDVETAARDQGTIITRAEQLAKLVATLSKNTGEPVTRLTETLSGQRVSVLIDYALAPDTRPENVLARAIMLFRLAIAACSANGTVAGRMNDVIRPWIKYYLCKVGLPGLNVGERDDPYVYSEDYREAVNALSTKPLTDLSSYVMTHLNPIEMLTRADAALVWAL